MANETALPDLRLSYRRHRPALRDAVARMRSWAPKRIILAHGRWYPTDGARELERAFCWVEVGSASSARSARP